MAVVRAGSPLQGELSDVPVIGTGMRNGLDVFTARKIRELVRRHRPTVVQTHLGRASRLTRIPKGSETLHVARLGGFYRANAYRHADAWVGNTRGICDHLRDLGFPPKRVFHIGNFVADSTPEGYSKDVRESLGISPECTVIFSLGRFVEKKASSTSSRHSLTFSRSSEGDRWFSCWLATGRIGVSWKRGHTSSTS